MAKDIILATIDAAANYHEEDLTYCSTAMDDSMGKVPLGHSDFVLSSLDKHSVHKTESKFPRRFISQEVLGVRLDDVPSDALIAEMIRSMAAGDRLLVLNVNAWLLTLAKNRPWLRNQFRNADIVYADGAGAQVAARILTGVTPTRSTAPDWIETLGYTMALQNKSVFWLGAGKEVICKAAENLSAKTGVRIAGWHHGFFNKSPNSIENRAVVQYINDSAADLLIVNMGMPIQEQWLHENWNQLNVKVAFTGGALAERVGGFVRPRPPKWVSDCGLEWATRLIAEPRRLCYRYLVGLPMLGMQILFALVKGHKSEALQTCRRCHSVNLSHHNDIHECSECHSFWCLQ
jgi:N-acetylglucosaminyldiphosphoundecaprenol N-acetyl-beta-D-mannosaminyltransferase